jgi:hypothetical protein
MKSVCQDEGEKKGKIDTRVKRWYFFLKPGQVTREEKFPIDRVMS